MHGRRIPWTVALPCLAAGFVVIGLGSLCLGAECVSPRRLMAVIMAGQGTVEHTILFRIRLPRVLLGLAVGGALSLAGVMLQGIFRNPLVEPYTLGISGGAALGVCLNVLLRLSRNIGSWTMPLAGFLGALASITMVSLLMVRKRVTRVRDLLLVGVMISFVCSSLVMLIMAVSRQEDLHGIVFWLMGSLEESNLFLIGCAALVSLLSLGVSWIFSLDLNAMALGEEEAMHLGVRVETAKRVLFLLASLATGLSVSVAGVIGFVGLVVPHFMRLFVGGDHRVLLPSSWLCGAAFLVLCDTLARTVVSPIVLPVGVITGILGGSLFVYALSAGKSTLWGRR
jgi:iron complex transport system permease protein